MTGILINPRGTQVKNNEQERLWGKKKEGCWEKSTNQYRSWRTYVGIIFYCFLRNLSRNLILLIPSSLPAPLLQSFN